MRNAELRITDYGLRIKKIVSLSAFICVHLWLISFASCRSQPIDLRSFAPSDTLVYLETNDLGKTLDALTTNKAFADAAKSQPDFSRLKNIQLAVVVTGFETSENQVTEDNSDLNFKPHFVAVAETHAWNWQTLRFAENDLNRFVKSNYGEDAKLETTEKNGGKLFAWTANDSRKVFAFVENSRVFFGSDEAAIEKCLAVSRGESESLAKSGREFAAAENQIAAGFISSGGIAQIADVAGVQAALKTTEDGAGRTFIARLLPTLLKNSVKEIVWTATRTDAGIADKFVVTTAPEVSQITKETLHADSNTSADYAEFLPSNVYSSTVYNVSDPLIAWRSLLLVTVKQTDAQSANILKQFSGSLLGSYGVADAETFLSAVDSPVTTAQFDADGDQSIVVANIKNAENLKKSIAGINFKSLPENVYNAEIWKTEDGETSAALTENKLILGDSEAVINCLKTKQFNTNTANKPTQNQSAAVTRGKQSAEKIVEILGEKKAENLQLTVNFTTETRFTEKGIERQTLSPFGLIGSLIGQIKE